MLQATMRESASDRASSQGRVEGSYQGGKHMQREAVRQRQHCVSASGSQMGPRSFAVALLLCASCIIVSQAATDPAQAAALGSLQQAWGGPVTEQWSQGSDPCDTPWPGVVCDRTTGSVIELNLGGAGLSGSLVPSLFSLTTLTRLFLANNTALSGTLPESFSSLRQLKHLAVGNCSFSGPLPASLGMLSLTYISVRQNHLSGTLPDNLAALRDLNWFDITRNNFTGPLPDGMVTLTSLGHLHLSYNRLTSLPAGISKLSNLIHLLADNNAITSVFPVGLLSMESINIIQLSNNRIYLEGSTVLLTGTAPSLLELVASNAFELPGLMPLPDISTLPSLEILDLSDNKLFYGNISNFNFAGAKRLITLDLGGNSLYGNLPPASSIPTTLEQLNVDRNNLSGILGDYSRLSQTKINLEGNQYRDQVALSNFNPTNGTNMSFGMWLAGNPVCLEPVNATIPQCQEGACSVVVRNLTNDVICPLDIVESCKGLTQLSPTRGTFLPSPPIFYSTTGTPQERCKCESPLRVYLYLNTTAFRSFTIRRSEKVKAQTLSALKMFQPSISLDPSQLVVSEVGTQSCGRQFVMTLDFFPLPPSSGQALDVQGIGNFFNTRPGYLDESEFGLQYVQKLQEPAPVPSTSPSSDALSAGQIAGIVVGCVVGVALLLALVAYLVHWRTKRAYPAAPWTQEDEEVLKSLLMIKQVTRYSKKELEDATGSFSKEALLGTGGYGWVYKGVLPAGSPGAGAVVAVKRAKPQVQQGGQDFRNEIELLSRVRHRNLVELKGFCREPGEEMLVFEFVPGGTLAQWIHHPQAGTFHPLSWKQRMQIAIGSARGLSYLHNQIQPPIIHRDIKPANILIDNDFNAKVADFGLSREVEEESNSAGIETKIKGTLGYLDPDYYTTQLLTERSDVYSFGVVLLELATGMPVFEDNIHIRKRVLDRVKVGGVASVMDRSLHAAGPPDAQVFEAFLRLAMLCSTKTLMGRPRIEEVERQLLDLNGGGESWRRSHSSLGANSDFRNVGRGSLSSTGVGTGTNGSSRAGRGASDGSSGSSHGRGLASGQAAASGTGSSTPTEHVVSFEEEEEEEEELHAPLGGAYPANPASTWPGESAESFPGDSQAFVGRDGELVDNIGVQEQSGVIAR